MFSERTALTAMQTLNRRQITPRIKLYLSKKLNLPLVKPERVNLVINNTCNLQCVMCDLWKVQDDQVLSLDQVRKLLDEMAAWGTKFLTLTGGEPLLHPDFFRIVEEAADRGITTEVNSNAAFGEALAERIQASRLDRFNISLDGTRPETHDAIRGRPGTFDRVVRLIQALNRRRSSSADRPVLIITCTIMNQNLEELPGMIDFARRHLFSGVSYNTVTSGLFGLKPGRRFAPPKKLPPYWVPPERYGVLDRSIDALLAVKREDPGIIHVPARYLELVKDYFRFRLPSSVNNCFAGLKNLHVAPNGIVGSCGGTFGTIRRPLWQNWRSSRAFVARLRIARCRKPCLVGCHTDTEAENLGGLIRDWFRADR